MVLRAPPLAPRNGQRLRLARRAPGGAASNGIDRVVTDKDERNEPMLAINRRLGYEPFTERRGYLKER
jgi:RimJ/RimL family protein N-acetyltransferase